MRREEREFLLQNGKYEEYATEGGRKILLFWGPYAEHEKGYGNVAKRGYAVDVEGSSPSDPWSRTWWPTLEAADRQVFSLRAKNPIDIAREALRLPIRNQPKE